MNHAIHLVACKASSFIPLEVETFVKSCFKFFKNSAKRVAQFNDIIEKMNLEVKKLLKPGQTRWLSLELAVERILDLWELLLKYFTELKEESLVESMKDKVIKVYLQFMSVFLKRFNTINILFQREVSQIFDARDELFKFFVNLATNILNSSLIIDGVTKFLDPSTILQLNFGDDDLNIYLLTPEQQYEHFIKVYGNVITLKDLSKNQGIEVCIIFR